MYAPSFITGSLMTRFGIELITGIGLVLVTLTALVGLAGISVAHFSTALILLGVGWESRFHWRHYHGDPVPSDGRTQQSAGVQRLHDLR
jgi:hypothetical protein